MLKKQTTIDPNRKPAGIQAAKNAGIYSLFAKIITEVWQKILLATRQAVHKTKARGEDALPKSDNTTIDAIDLPGTVWVYGCSTAAGDIAAGYDHSEYADYDDNAPLDKRSLEARIIDACDNTCSKGPLADSHAGVNGRTT